MTDHKTTWDDTYRGLSGCRWWPCEELVRSVAGRGDYTGDTLEVGCGNGANLWFLAEKAARTVGVDFSKGALACAADYVHVMRRRKEVELVLADLLEGLKFRDGEFSTVVDCMTSQHLPWRLHGPTYEEYFRVLKPGGFLFLYHLDDRTRHGPGAVLAAEESFFDYDMLPLFPSVGLVCMPPMSRLVDLVRLVGFSVKSRRCVRESSLGTATYTVIEAEKKRT